MNTPSELTEVSSRYRKLEERVRKIARRIEAARFG